MRCGTKTDLFTCLNTPTGHATIVKQATIVVHGVTHTGTYMEPHIPNFKHIDALMDVYPEENILIVLTHQQHGNNSQKSAIW